MALIILFIVFIISSLIISKKTVSLVIDGKKSTITTYKGTVENILKEENVSIYSKDKVNPSLDSKIKDSGTITIKRAVNVQVLVDGKTIETKSAENTIEDMLKAEEINLNNFDKISPVKDTLIADSMKIEIIRVESKTISETSVVSYNTVIKNDSNLANTIKKTIQDGSNGEKSTTFEVVYEDGKEVCRKIINETITKKSVDKIICQGTLPVVPISRGGDPIGYTKVFKSRATAYSAIHGIGKTYTASGRKAVRDPNGYSTIAVDPKVIPLGSKVFVEGYGFAIAADTGSAIKGTTIDVFFDTLPEAKKWAVKNVNVYVLK